MGGVGVEVGFLQERAEDGEARLEIALPLAGASFTERAVDVLLQMAKPPEWSDGITCDEGCCTNGDVCAFGRCVPEVPCDDNDQCSADSQCSAGNCAPWNVLPDGNRFSRACRNVIDLPSVIPEIQCQWPGDTPPRHAIA